MVNPLIQAEHFRYLFIAEWAAKKHEKDEKNGKTKRSRRISLLFVHVELMKMENERDSERWRKRGKITTGEYYDSFAEVDDRQTNQDDFKMTLISACCFCCFIERTEE